VFRTRDGCRAEAAKPRRRTRRAACRSRAAAARCLAETPFE